MTNPARCRRPIIVCTADLQELERRQPDLRYLDDVHIVTKPFTVDAICHLIEVVLARDIRWDLPIGMPRASGGLRNEHASS